MAWKMSWLIVFICVPYILGKDLCRYNWWSGMVIDGLPYWIQGMLALYFAFWIAVACGLIVIITFWLSGKHS